MATAASLPAVAAVVSIVLRRSRPAFAVSRCLCGILLQASDAVCTDHDAAEGEGEGEGEGRAASSSSSRICRMRASGNVRVHRVAARLSKGPTFGRHLADVLYQGETFA